MEFEYSNGYVSRVKKRSSLYGCFLLLPLINVECLILCHRPVKALLQGLYLILYKDIIFWFPDLMRSRGGRLLYHLELLWKYFSVNF